LQEHYGFTIGESTIQRIVLGHARNMFEAGRPSRDFPKTPGRHKDIIAQTDGGMIHIVEPDPDQRDKRKGKQLSRREGKISLAHAKGSRTPVYAGTIEGGVETAGRQLLECAVRAGFGSDSYVHAVGDGAPRIVGQVEEQFGAQGNYLIDFYHVCEYLSAAAEAIAPNAAARDGDAKGRAEDGASGECAAAARSPLRSPSRGRRPSSSAAMPSLFERSRNQLKYKDALAKESADRLWRDRKRASLYRATTPEAAWSLVARETCRISARTAHHPQKRRLRSLLGHGRQTRLARKGRKSEPANRITKSSSLIA
jgi:hypothetical protein